MDEQRQEERETARRVEWRASERDALAAVTAEAVADRAVAAARAAEAAAVESQAVARDAAAASVRAAQAAERAIEAARFAATTAASAMAAAEAERRAAHEDVAATIAAESNASDRFQDAQHARRFEANQAHPRPHNEIITADGDEAEFETYNEFLGATLEVHIDGQRVEAKPILGNRGFRLSSPPANGCEVRVYYEVAGLLRPGETEGEGQ
jgi:hypothetical protein